MKVNKPFTRKKDLRTNLRDAQTAERPRNNSKEVAVATVAEIEVAAEVPAAAEIDGKLKESFNSPFLFNHFAANLSLNNIYIYNIVVKCKIIRLQVTKMW
jgi:hypothetical protein